MSSIKSVTFQSEDGLCSFGYFSYALVFPLKFLNSTFSTSHLCVTFSDHLVPPEKKTLVYWQKRFICLCGY